MVWLFVTGNPCDWIYAVIAGVDGWVAIETFGKGKEKWLKRFLSLEKGIGLSKATLRNIPQNVIIALLTVGDPLTATQLRNGVFTA
jgi:hypothetical protein